MYEMKADLSGNIWSAAPESATVNRLTPDGGKIEDVDMHWIIDARFLETVIEQEEAERPEGMTVKDERELTTTA